MAKLPDGVSFISADSGGAYDADAHTLTWTLPGGLQPAASATLTYTASMDVPGNWPAVACVNAVDVNDNHTTDCATIILTITGVPTSTPTPSPSPSATSTPTPPPAAPGPGAPAATPTPTRTGAPATATTTPTPRAPTFTPTPVTPVVQPTLTPDEMDLLEEATTVVEEQEEAEGVVEKAPPDPDEPGAPPAQVPIQVPPRP